MTVRNIALLMCLIGSSAVSVRAMEEAVTDAAKPPTSKPSTPVVSGSEDGPDTDKPGQLKTPKGPNFLQRHFTKDNFQRFAPGAVVATAGTTALATLCSQASHQQRAFAVGRVAIVLEGLVRNYFINTLDPGYDATVLIKLLDFVIAEWDKVEKSATTSGVLIPLFYGFCMATSAVHAWQTKEKTSMGAALAGFLTTLLTAIAAGIRGDNNKQVAHVLRKLRAMLSDPEYMKQYASPEAASLDVYATLDAMKEIGGSGSTSCLIAASALGSLAVGGSHALKYRSI